MNLCIRSTNMQTKKPDIKEKVQNVYNQAHYTIVFFPGIGKECRNEF